MPNLRRHLDAHVMETAENELEAEGLVADVKPSAMKQPMRAAGKYTFPLTNNRSSRIPPRPCWHCGSPLHYNRECASWKQQNCPEVKNLPTSKANEAYHKLYIAMLECDNEEFNKNCSAFHALIDTNHATGSYVVIYDYGENKALEPIEEPQSYALLVIEEQEETMWSSMLVKHV